MKKSVYILLVLLIITGTSIAQEQLSLNEAIGIALKRNFNVQLAQNDVEIARASNSWAAAGKLPTASLNGFNTNSLTNLNQKLNNGTEIVRNGVRLSLIHI